MITTFTTEEAVMLSDQGFVPGWLSDVQEGDLVAIAPVTRHSFDGEDKVVQTYTVQRLQRVDGSYYSEEQDELVRNTVISFIAANLDGVPMHLSYGSTYPCFYKREGQ